MSKGLIKGLQVVHTQSMKMQEKHTHTHTTHSQTHTHKYTLKQKQGSSFIPYKTCLTLAHAPQTSGPAFLFTTSLYLSSTPTASLSLSHTRTHTHKHILSLSLPPTVKGDCSSRKLEKPNPIVEPIVQVAIMTTV